MPSWTAPGDVLDAWIGENKPTDTGLVQKWIDKAEREIRRAVPDIQTRLDIDPPIADLLDNVKDVTAAMVTRVLKNPDGARQRQTTTGPFSDSVTLAGDNPGTLYLTSDELGKLQGSSTTGGAFSIDLIPSTSPFFVEPA